MLLKPKKDGFYDEQTVLMSKLPVIEWDEMGEIPWFSYSDLKNILNIHLTDYERLNYIDAFERARNGRGYIALYSFVEVLQLRISNPNPEGVSGASERI